MKNYGGKANSLIKLKENNFNVPDFFVIEAKEFEEFLKENNLEEKIRKLLENKKYEEIKQIIINANMKEELKEKIIKKFKDLNMHMVSVRSSASNEDGIDKSYAGQYKSLLNVKLDNLLESIKICWSSLYSENVVVYSSEFSCGMNVIVQKMVEADYAGVAFSIDPGSDTRNYSIIEIVEGLGEKLVSGKATPTKFIVRRETSHIDLKIGEILLNEDVINNLEILILEIEKLYNVPVDVEFAILNNEIYILQARPITAIEVVPKNFSLTISRPNSLIEKSIYFNGEYEGIKSLTKNLYYFKPLFIYDSKTKSTQIYYNEYDLEEDPRLMYYYIDLYFDDVLNEYEKIKKYIKELNKIIDNKKDFDFNLFVDKLVSIYPFASLGQLAGHFDNITSRLRDMLYDFRFNYDYIIHKSCDYLLEYVEKNLPNDLRLYKDYITIEEYKSGIFPSIDILKRRKNGYIFFDNEIVLENYDNWLKSKNINIVVDDDSTMKGQVIFSGNVEGTVCKVFCEDDFSKVKQGDILVTPMTTPKFVKVIKKVKGIITDEGGVTCHAAIISRELKIPCIVGCKNATKILQDGDLVKLNASTGKISIIK